MSLFGKLADPFLVQADRARKRPFLDAAMAAAASVASAEGPITFAKRGALDRILESVEPLKPFDVHEAIDLFNDYAGDLRDHAKEGRSEVLKAVSAVKGDAEKSQLVIRIACAIGRANGVYAPREIARIHELASTLELDAPDLGEGLVAEGGRPTVITLGNQKGGTGKSTTAMQLAVALIKLGYKVGSIDLDGTQGTLSRYIDNRGNLGRANGREILLPKHRRIEPSAAPNRDAKEGEERARLQEAMAALADRDYVVIDTPGSDSYLARLGHAQADLLITPLNDSLLDVDILAEIDPHKRQVLGPSAYCKMIWDQNDRRTTSAQAPIDWIVMRNRLAHINARNNREISGLLTQLSARIGFRLEPGFSERVIFRELFFKGLTLLDLPEDSDGEPKIASHRNARKELRDLLRAIGVENAGAV